MGQGFHLFFRRVQERTYAEPRCALQQEIKFRAFLEKALDLEADYLATGALRQIGCEDGRHTLLGEPMAARTVLFPIP